MSSGDPAGTPTELLRAAVQEAIGIRSVRSVAREVGISHTGLRGFLRGARPHRHTRRKLARWLARARTMSLREPGRRYAESPGRASYELAVAVVRSLAAETGPAGADRAQAELASLLKTLYREAGLSAPPWLR